MLGLARPSQEERSGRALSNSEIWAEAVAGKPFVFSSHQLWMRNSSKSKPANLQEHHIPRCVRANYAEKTRASGEHGRAQAVPAGCEATARHSLIVAWPFAGAYLSERRTSTPIFSRLVHAYGCFIRTSTILCLLLMRKAFK